MRVVMLVLAVALGGNLMPASALGQGQPPLAPGLRQSAERWSFKRVDDGFVRLDAKTGRVAHCTPVSAGWTCQAVPEDRSALEKEIAHLRDEIAALKKEVARLRAARPPGPPGTADHSGDIGLKMPTRQDVARAKDYLAQTWSRLVQMIEQFQKDVLRNG
jgi:hypothetical protein